MNFSWKDSLDKAFDGRASSAFAKNEALKILYEVDQDLEDTKDHLIRVSNAHYGIIDEGERSRIVKRAHLLSSERDAREDEICVLKKKIQNMTLTLWLVTITLLFTTLLGVVL